MSNAGGKHPQVLDFVIDTAKAMDLEVKELAASIDAAIGALYRDREKCKALGLEWPDDLQIAYSLLLFERDYRKSNDFVEHLKEHFGRKA